MNWPWSRPRVVVLRQEGADGVTRECRVGDVMRVHVNWTQEQNGAGTSASVEVHTMSTVRVVDIR